jgi:SAM-dependent methyltransferase
VPNYQTTITESVACDLCGETRTAHLFKSRDLLYGTPGEWDIVRCCRCKLLYVNPRPDRASIGAYYPDMDYHAFKQTGKKSGGIKARIVESRRKREAQGMLAGLPHGANVLEIGCGTGDMLVMLRDLGANVTGIEPNHAAADVGRARGLTIHTGMLDDATLPESSFDLVFMRYALEHVHSPRAVLQRIEALLRPGGRAVFLIPNAHSLDAKLFGKWWRGLDSPRHLYLFTPRIMSRYAEIAGLRVAQIAFEGVPNDWAGSAQEWLRGYGLPFANALGLDNPLVLAAWTPISIAAAALGLAGRMAVWVEK